MPIYVIHCPNPLAFPHAKGDLTQSSWRKEEEEPRIRIKERWPVSTLIVSWFIFQVIKEHFSRTNAWVIYGLVNLYLISNP